MAQTGYKCFSNGIKAVPRDPMPTASPLQQAWGHPMSAVAHLPFGLRHTLLFFPVPPLWFPNHPQRALQGTWVA